MKKIMIAAIAILVSGTSVFGQFYERTGKNYGMYFSVQPLSVLKKSGDPFSITNVNGSLGFVSIVSKGVYPSFGYTYSHRLNTGVRNTSFPTRESHMLDASLLINKRLVTLMNKRIRGICHYVSLGLIFAPEYHYMFGTSEHPNESFGEVGGQIGLSLYHHYSASSKRGRSKTRQFELFYRQGFTPIFTETINGNEQKYFRQEIGIRVRLIHRQVYDFLK
jgi:hypothetical protein